MKLVHTARIEHEDGTVETAKVVRVDDLRIPIPITLGRLEAATPEELREHLTDLTHELARR